MIDAVVLNRRYEKFGKAPLLLSPIRKLARNHMLEEIENKKIEIVDINCPNCQSSNSETISEVDYFGFPVSIAVCVNCGLVYTSRKISDTSLNNIYESTLYGQIDRGSPEPSSSHFERGFLKGEKIYAHISKLRKPRPNQTVLDIGCGTGGVLAYFKSQGCLITGLDPGKENIHFGRDLKDLNLLCGDVNELDSFLETSTSFDIIILEQTLEHFSDPILILKLLSKRLKSDGLIYIGVPGLLSIREHYDGDLRRYFQFPHLVHFTSRSLGSILASAGFKLIWCNEEISAIAVLSPIIAPQIQTDPQEILIYVSELKTEFWSTRRVIKRFFFTYPIWIMGYVRARITNISK